MPTQGSAPPPLPLQTEILDVLRTQIDTAAELDSNVSLQVFSAHFLRDELQALNVVRLMNVPLNECSSSIGVTLLLLIINKEQVELICFGQWPTVAPGLRQRGCVCVCVCW